MTWPLVISLLMALMVGDLALVVLNFRTRRFLQGRHISRPLIRRIGYVRTSCTPSAIPIASFATEMSLLATSSSPWVLAPYAAGLSVLAIWLLDDLLFSDDEDRKRKHEWARVRIRMPKPVKLRPVERVPSPA